MNLAPSNELLSNGQKKFDNVGTPNRKNGKIVSAAIEIDNNFTLIAPIFVPDVADLKAFAEQLHQTGEAWQGLAFGWYATYEPQGHRNVPEGSKVAVSPASFCLGDATAWCYCLTWDDGIDQEPTEIITSSLLEN